MKQRVIIQKFAVLLTFVFLFSCGGGSPKINYYRLIPYDGLNVNDQPFVTEGNISAAIGPLSIADSLKRPQLVTRKANGQLQFASTEYWAGQLENEIEAALIYNLSFLLNTDQISTFDDILGATPEYQIIITLERFEGAPEMEANLTARWAIIDHKQKSALQVRRSEIKTILPTNDYPALVHATSEALYIFSQEIAKELTSQHLAKSISQ